MKLANFQYKKMKKTIYTAFIWLFAVAAAMGQNGGTLDKIESARIALITERLELSPEQAEKFWPVYREYSMQREELRREFMQARRQVDRRQLSEEESQRLLQLGMQIKEREVMLDRTYNERLVNVISNRQLLELRKAEQDFRRMLMERLQRRQDGAQRGVPPGEEHWRQRQQNRGNNK